MKIKCPYCENQKTKELYRHRKEEDDNDVRFMYKCLNCGNEFIVSARFTHCEDIGWEKVWNPDTGLFEDIVESTCADVEENIEILKNKIEDLKDELSRSYSKNMIEIQKRERKVREDIY